MSTIRDQVMEFHAAFGIPVGESPRVPDNERVRLRLKLIAEEFTELLESCAGKSLTRAMQIGDIGLAIEEFVESSEAFDVDLPAFADACADLDYVVEGARIELGVNGEPIADEVHRANMAKSGGPVRADGKRMKPADWTPPDIAARLREQGWTP